MVMLARVAGWARVAGLAGLALSTPACGGTLDAGYDLPKGKLPVDERNPVVIDNDGWSDNWMGEYAALLANNGGPALKGIIVNKSTYWTDHALNTSGWKRMVAAARTSGLKNIPEITGSAGTPLERPADGNIDSTVPNDAAGARQIVELSRQFSLPHRPLVVICGSGLTNVADAYLIDHSVADRVVVVASLGGYAMSSGHMAGPNGELDPWADWIVTQRFTYVQVSAFYNQLNDVTTAQIPDLPPKPLGAWMADKVDDILAVPSASDQVAVLAVGHPEFVAAVQRASPDTSGAFDTSQGPPLKPDPAGKTWIVTKIAAPLAPSKLWQMLLEPRTYDP
jgi:hypothetical protein